MKVKKFIAPTMPEAMYKIRKELGNDAVILNSKVIQQGGFLGLFTKKNIEVIAAVDPQPAKPKQERPNMNPTVNQREDAAALFTSINATKPTIDDDMLQEIRELKKIMQNQNTQVGPKYPDKLQHLYQSILEQEVYERHAKTLMDPILERYYAHQADVSHEELVQWLKESLADLLKPLSFGGITYEKQFVHLVGPTGVGKTTTLAKIAADSVLKDRKKVAFITTDTYRIAAIDQLKTYAKILDIPLEIAYNIEDYQKAREKFKNYDLVLVDTAGRNFRNPKYVKELQKVVDIHNDLETFLVLSLTSKVKDLETIFKQFSEVPIRKLIFTKVDETSQYGAVLNLLIEEKVGVAYLTDGQNVPDDIKEASSKRIISTIVGELTNE